MTVPFDLNSLFARKYLRARPLYYAPMASRYLQLDADVSLTQFITDMHQRETGLNRVASMT